MGKCGILSVQFATHGKGEISVIHIAICDDEKSMQLFLKNIVEIHLQLRGQEFKITCFDTGEHFLQTNSTYDIIFLDIEMGQLGGMQTAREIRKYDTNCIIIFVTAFADFVFQGYEVKALNYILKPFKKEKIKDVLDSALVELHKKKDLFVLAEIKGTTQKIDLSKTLYFTSDKRKVMAVTQSESYEFYAKLDDIIDTMNLPPFFIRIHQRYIVNLNFIASLQTESCVIKGATIPVSRKYNTDIMIAFAKLMLD